jgi:hypothetical protein
MPPTSGIALSVTGLASSTAAILATGAASSPGLRAVGSATAGVSFGIDTVAGTNSSDYSFRCFNAASVPLFFVRGDGQAITYELLNGINAQKNVASFDTGTFNGTITGCTTSPAATFNWARSGNVIVMDCNAGLSATSNTTAMTITGVPSALTPARNQNIVTRVTDNGAVGLGIVSIAGTTMTFGNGIGGGAFTGSGTKGIGGGFQFVYQLT